MYWFSLNRRNSPGAILIGVELHPSVRRPGGGPEHHQPRALRGHGNRLSAGAGRHGHDESHGIGEFTVKYAGQMPAYHRWRMKNTVLKSRIHTIV